MKQQMVSTKNCDLLLTQRWHNFRIVTRLAEKEIFSICTTYCGFFFLEKEGQGTNNKLVVRPLKWLLAFFLFYYVDRFFLALFFCEN